MQFLSFSERVRLENEDLIVIYRGVNHIAQSVFAYIICNKEGILKMRNDYEANAVAPMDSYGKVIYWDVGFGPDESAENYLRDFVSNYAHLKNFL